MRQFLAFLLLLTLIACSQVPNDTALPDLAPSAFTGGDVASLAKHSSGVYAAGKIFDDDTYTSNAFIRKYDTRGVVLWSKMFGPLGYNEPYVQSVASDSSDNAYTAGITDEGQYYAAKLFLRKHTSSGRIAWTRQFGSSRYRDEVSSVAVYGNSVYVVWQTQEGSGDSAGDSYGFIRKYDDNGSIVWTRKINTSDLDAALDVAADGSGNAYVVGYTYGALGSTNGSGSDMFIRKYSPGGKVLWTRQRHYSDYDFAENVAVSGSNVYLVGSFLKGNNWDTGYSSIRVVKYSTSGSLVWDKSYGTSGVNPQVNDISADSNGNLYVAGTGYDSGSEYYQSVIKLNSSGSHVWKKLSTTFYPNAVLSRTNSEVYVGGLGLSRLKSTDGSTVWADQHDNYDLCDYEDCAGHGL